MKNMLRLPKHTTGGECPWCGTSVCNHLDPARPDSEKAAKEIEACPECAMPILVEVEELDCECPHCGQDMPNPECEWRIKARRTQADMAYMAEFSLTEADATAEYEAPE